MSALTKAQLGEITSGDSPTEVPDTLVDVQFNPTTLRVQISNRTAGGQQSGAQARQRPGTGDMQVSFDLVFDTADEGTTDQGVSVLEKTKSVERFVRPKGNRAGEEAPPRVIFKWGSFLVQGTMESANIDLDLFDSQGVPLRAKVAVTIKGQDPRWTYTPAPTPPASSGTGAPATATPTQLPPGTPGTSGSKSVPERILQAMPGESLAQLAQRAGLDPSAWRALAQGLSNPLKLQLGQEVPLPKVSNASASASANRSQDPAGAAAALPLVSAPASQATRPGAAASSARQDIDPVRKGQAVTAQGGMQQAISQHKDRTHQNAANTSLNAFGMVTGETGDVTDRPWGAGVPLRPRFGGSAAAGRGLKAPAWQARVSTPSGEHKSGGTATAYSRARSLSNKAGCGCQGRKSRPRNP
jgi:LysM repeat protein